MKRKKAYLVLFIVVILTTIISSLIAFNNPLTGLVAHDLLPETDTTAAEGLAPANDLQSSVNNLQTKVIFLESGLAKNEQDINRLNANLQSVNSQLVQLQQQVDSQLSTISTGLAGLQEDVVSTQTQFNRFASGLQRRRIFFILITAFSILAVVFAGIYFYQKGSWGGTRTDVHPKMMDYITNHIKAGRKFDHIKDSLLSAGWSEEAIVKAYKATIRRNYHHYKKKSPVDNQNLKIVAGIGVIVIFTGVIIFFSFSSSTGQAYQIYGGVEDYEEGTGLDRNISQRQCFPPRIMINNQCCDDRNRNQVCDDAEGYAETATNLSCTDNLACTHGRSCVEGQCRFITDLYQTTACNEFCTVVRVKVTTFNRDPSNQVVSQEYTLRMGLGSYTAGGALDWTIVPIPDFCKPASATRIHQQSNTWRANIPVPFEIREFNNSLLLGTRVETINTGQQKMITHRALDLDQFTLKIDDVHLTCGTQSVFG